MRVAVQGFGNVGATAARLFHEAGANVVAVCDSISGIYNPRGLDMPALMPCFRRDGSLSEQPGGEPITPEALLELPVDILVPAAVENQITTANAARIQAGIIVEGANGPTTPAADRMLHERGVLLIPDILANAGGVIVSYFEWVQDLQSFFWAENEVNDRMEQMLLRAYRDVESVSLRDGLDRRTAAYMIGVKRVADAITLRGIYP
jgi:glutamate dehydrogenase (NAD(P)+)